MSDDDSCGRLERDHTLLSQRIAAITQSTKGLRDVLRPLAEIQARVAGVAKVADAARRLSAHLERFGPDVCEAFNRAGFPPCRWLSLSDCQRIVIAYQSDGTAEAASLVEQEFRVLLTDERMRREVLADWARNPLLAKRLHILRDAYKAAAEGRYCLAVPVFYAQLEGIIAEGMRHSGALRGRDYKRLVSSLAEEDELLGPVMSTFVADVALANFQHGDPLPDLSRHAILHGADTEYGTERNALRVIALFDYVQDLLIPSSSKAEHSRTDESCGEA